MFLKEYKNLLKKVIRHINENLSGLSYSDDSDDEWVKAMKLMFFENIFLK